MDFLKQGVHVLTMMLDVVIASFFASILLITILQVILRYVFNASVLGGNETMEALFIYTTAIGAAAAVRRRQHINIKYFVQLLPTWLQRLTDITAHMLVAFLNAVMIFYSISWISKVGTNESPVMRIPEWIFQLSIPIGCSLVIVFCLFNIVLIVWNDQPAEGDEPC